MSFNDTSSPSHVCDKIAYLGMFLPMNSSKRPVLVLMSLMLKSVGHGSLSQSEELWNPASFPQTIMYY